MTRLATISKDTVNQLRKIEVYLDDGRVYSYEVEGEDKVREHIAAIIKDGYRHNDGNVFEHYPPHRLIKVKCRAVLETKYTDSHTGT